MKYFDENIVTEINNIPSIEEKSLVIPLDKSFREIVLENREWLCGGLTGSWQYQFTPERSKIIMCRW